MYEEFPTSVHSTTSLAEHMYSQRNASYQEYAHKVPKWPCLRCSENMYETIIKP